MKRLLKRNEYLHFAPEHVGIVRVNHQGDYCSGDSLSMLVERKEDGSVAAHCFRCGSGGFTPASPKYRDPRAIREASERRNRTPDGDVYVGGIGLPGDSTGDYGQFLPGARAWLSKAGLTQETVEKENFIWSDEHQCLYIPVRQDGDLVGYVQRFYDTDDPKKRYKTRSLDKSNFFGYYKRFDKPGDTVVIVEDTLSGLRVKELCDTLVALGTNLLPAAESLLIRQGYKNAVIFLDADNGIVRNEARRMGRKLSWMNVRYVETGKDPKYHSDAELTSLLTSANIIVTSNSN